MPTNAGPTEAESLSFLNPGRIVSPLPPLFVFVKGDGDLLGFKIMISVELIGMQKGNRSRLPCRNSRSLPRWSPHSDLKDAL